MLQPRKSSANAPEPTPLGMLPGWISADLLKQTIDTWQPYYTQPLTEQDALEILQNVKQLFAVLERSNVQAVRRTGTGVES
jgi:hypothetical protein